MSCSVVLLSNLESDVQTEPGDLNRWGESNGLTIKKLSWPTFTVWTSYSELHILNLHIPTATRTLLSVLKGPDRLGSHLIWEMLSIRWILLVNKSFEVLNDSPDDHLVIFAAANSHTHRSHKQKSSFRSGVFLFFSQALACHF